MGFNDLLKDAFNVGNETKFIVYLGNEEAKEMNYIELGIFLVGNAFNVESVKINLKE